MTKKILLVQNVNLLPDLVRELTDAFRDDHGIDTEITQTDTYEEALRLLDQDKFDAVIVHPHYMATEDSFEPARDDIHGLYPGLHVVKKAVDQNQPKVIVFSDWSTSQLLKTKVNTETGVNEDNIVLPRPNPRRYADKIAQLMR